MDISCAKDTTANVGSQMGVIEVLSKHRDVRHSMRTFVKCNGLNAFSINNVNGNGLVYELSSLLHLNISSTVNA